MASPLTTNDKIIRALAVVLVLIFASVLVWRLTPLGTPESGAILTDEAIGAPEEAESTPPEEDAATSQSVMVTLQLPEGPVELELWPDVAPRHVERIVTLAEDNFYDGIVFHRVIEGFMAQTGDPTGTGAGGSDLPDLPAEFSDISFERGVLGMARSSNPNSANSQFFIMLDNAPHLNGQYTAFGRVVSGMEYVDAIKKGDPAQNGLVDDPDSIVSMTPEDDRS